MNDFTVLFLKHYSLKRKVVTDEERPADPADVAESPDADISPARTIRDDLEDQKAASTSERKTAEEEAYDSVQVLEPTRST